MRGSDAPGWSSALSATEAAKALRDGAYLPSEYVRDVLASAVSRNPEHRAFVEIYADQALRDAGVSDRRLARGAGRPLEGVAFAVKDVIDVKGHRTRGASQSTAADPVASADAEVVTQLRDNGAVLVGKLALEELGIGPTVEDSGAQRPVNPWNPDNSTGGSSSGCAVAVATGLVPIAIGTVDAEVSDAVADVVSVLRAHAAHVDQATMASLDTYQECGSTILHVEAFEQLVTVTTLRPPGPAFDADTSDDTSSTLSPRMPFNVVGAPAIAVPISLTANGLPLSMQLVGARGADYQLLALAHACEQALDGRVQRLTARRS